MSTLCQPELDLAAMKARQREIERQWDLLLAERREVEMRTRELSQREMQFDLKWNLLIQETQQLASDKDAFERKRLFYEQVAAHERAALAPKAQIVSGEMFFSGVRDKSALKKRYKDLIKIYHPDSENGDNETVQEINREYDNLSAIYQ